MFDRSNLPMPAMALMYSRPNGGEPRNAQELFGVTPEGDDALSDLDVMRAFSLDGTDPAFDPLSPDDPLLLPEHAAFLGALVFEGLVVVAGIDEPVVGGTSHLAPTNSWELQHEDWINARGRDPGFLDPAPVLRPIDVDEDPTEVDLPALPDEDDCGCSGPDAWSCWPC